MQTFLTKVKKSAKGDLNVSLLIIGYLQDVVDSIKKNC
jgi:hypothetical protein